MNMGNGTEVNGPGGPEAACAALLSTAAPRPGKGSDGTTAPLCNCPLEAGANCSGSTLEHAQCLSVLKHTDCDFCCFSLVNIPNEPLNRLEVPKDENALE